MSSPQPERNKIFISYSHMDTVWLERLQIYLKDLESRELIDRWGDTNIHSGMNWRKEIGVTLDSAKVTALHVSAGFIASDFIAPSKLLQLLAAAEEFQLNFGQCQERRGDTRLKLITASK